MKNDNSTEQSNASKPMLGDVFSQYVDDKNSIYKYGHLIKEHQDFKEEMEKCFVDNLKKSSFFIELIKVLKSTKIKNLDYCMGVFLMKIEGEEDTFTDTDLESLWLTDGIDLDNDEEPTKRVYQKELDAFNFLESIWVNDFMLDKPFFSEFEKSINEALSENIA